MTTPKILVIGQIRTGTSLTMQMLAAAGLNCAGIHPSYEPHEVGLHATPEGLLDVFAQYDAIKLPDLHATEAQNERPMLDPEAHYHIILTSRLRVQEQAESVFKMIKATGEMPSAWKPLRADYKNLIAGIKRAQREFYARLPGRMPASRFLLLNFEYMIMHPEKMAAKIAQFIGQGDALRMASVVVKRSTDCYKTMLETDLIAQDIGL